MRQRNPSPLLCRGAVLYRIINALAHEVPPLKPFARRFRYNGALKETASN